MGEKEKLCNPTLFTNFTHRVGFPSMEKFVHYSKDKITYKMLSFL